MRISLVVSGPTGSRKDVIMNSLIEAASKQVIIDANEPISYRETNNGTEPVLHTSFNYKLRIQYNLRPEPIQPTQSKDDQPKDTHKLKTNPSIHCALCGLPYYFFSVYPACAGVANTPTPTVTETQDNRLHINTACAMISFVMWGIGLAVGIMCNLSKPNIAACGFMSFILTYTTLCLGRWVNFLRKDIQ